MTANEYLYLSALGSKIYELKFASKLLEQKDSEIEKLTNKLHEQKEESIEHVEGN